MDLSHRGLEAANHAFGEQSYVKFAILQYLEKLFMNVENPATIVSTVKFLNNFLTFFRGAGTLAAIVLFYFAVKALRSGSQTVAAVLLVLAILTGWWVYDDWNERAVWQTQPSTMIPKKSL